MPHDPARAAAAQAAGRRLTRSGALDAFVAPLLGQRAWGVRQGYGSFLLLSFGAAPTDRTGWELWVHCRDWRVTLDGAEIASSMDTRERIAGIAAVLEGRALVGIAVDPSRPSIFASTAARL